MRNFSYFTEESQLVIISINCKTLDLERDRNLIGIYTSSKFVCSGTEPDTYLIVILASVLLSNDHAT